MQLRPIGSLPPNSYFFVAKQVYVIDHIFNAYGVPKTKLVLVRNIETGKRWLIYETKMVRPMSTTESEPKKCFCLREWLWKQLYLLGG